MPYTYLIGWRSMDVWYYGVRYAKGCTPSDLWVSYFTSSEHVKAFRKLHGDPDVVEDGKSLWDQRWPGRTKSEYYAA